MGDGRLSFDRLSPRSGPILRVGILALLSVGLTVSSGFVGTLVAISVGFGWWLAPGYFVFGFGQIAFAATQTGLGGIGGLLAQIALWALLVVSLVQAPSPLRVRAIRDVTVGSLVAVAVAWIAVSLLGPLWQTAIVVVGLSAGCFYAIHRYQLVRMGLVGEAR
ncbi:hypothetical protein [Halobellus clavatus]|jgi:hypothetical protein|uniref:DUF8163 domain-containing protein n=1 Tax=Halobellus clavatus TaxID=660517 RepID=A0A1H3FNU9_9EURY|nr:hypothetical protein [Halobellus clavatus]SDX92753.1 hypothetical protein SAMN04487946_10490 [Halobellus clavatus]